LPLRVLAPHIGGRIAFLIGPDSISMTESFTELVSHYQLGALVGAATAGTNGDIAEIAGPSGCTTWFTGRRVTRMDGRQHHLLGIPPTVPASRTLASVEAGRDEVLERGLAYVREPAPKAP
jgi:C-terminal processing protease CtpA/Prc